MRNEKFGETRTHGSLEEKDMESDGKETGTELRLYKLRGYSKFQECVAYVLYVHGTILSYCR